MRLKRLRRTRRTPRTPRRARPPQSRLQLRRHLQFHTATPTSTRTAIATTTPTHTLRRRRGRQALTHSQRTAVGAHTKALASERAHDTGGSALRTVRRCHVGLVVAAAAAAGRVGGWLERLGEVALHGHFAYGVGWTRARRASERRVGRVCVHVSWCGVHVQEVDITWTVLRRWDDARGANAALAG